MNINNKGYHRLLIWQKGKEFIGLVYKKTEGFPKSEIFGLQSQIRRASISFALNIVEGHRRRTTNDFLKFLNIADASLVEVEACLEIAIYLDFITQEDYEQLETNRQELAVMMQAFIRGTNKKNTL